MTSDMAQSFEKNFADAISLQTPGASSRSSEFSEYWIHEPDTD